MHSFFHLARWLAAGGEQDGAERIVALLLHGARPG